MLLACCEVLTVIFELTRNPPLATANINQCLKILPNQSRSHFWSLTGLEFVDFFDDWSFFFLPLCHNVLHLFAVT